MKRGERVLDLGCGNGALSRDIAERAEATVVGLELNEKSFSAARKFFSHKRVTYLKGDMEKDISGGIFRRGGPFQCS